MATRNKGRDPIAAAMERLAMDGRGGKWNARGRKPGNHEWVKGRDGRWRRTERVGRRGMAAVSFHSDGAALRALRKDLEAAGVPSEDVDAAMDAAAEAISESSGGRAATATKRERENEDGRTSDERVDSLLDDLSALI